MTAREILDRIGAEAPSGVVDLSMGIDCPQVVVQKESLIPFMEFLKKDSELAFDLISDVTAVDYADTRTPRFDVVYHIFSLKNNERIRVKVPVGEGEAVDSVTFLWRGAEWLEREVYDMFGIPFNNHPDLRRILMPEDYKYYPLRKEFPLEGIED
ncbi:NADH-quinone oxidoreductase subunit C [Thermodesulforhabdus norvegica]|uniref:NADH-quinone oxidoreductase subunit C n=1 Tax=Thermodesulforhabdus norvegica TaxID=39841 RepID=A0A1I4UKA6_9BACT|nr:NADH-quinone oxidoreductase subunit C [Thermodesulforhabdus norvegica]SFM89341.1 NADH-quinone oxidoreductase subunit C [Thermodesulforhabdus norvegica]